MLWGDALLHDVTWWYVMRHDGTAAAARRIDGVEYFTLTAVAEQVGVTRQTLWRWRRDKRVPAGRRLRNGTTLYSAQEIVVIQEYADHLEPVVLGEGRRQPRLFEADQRGRV